MTGIRRPMSIAESGAKRNAGQAGASQTAVTGVSASRTAASPAAAFRVGDRVYDKRDKIKSPGTLVGMRRHTNGSPKWLVAWDRENMRIWTWQVDLRHVDV